jgi:hypothetical protein
MQSGINGAAQEIQPHQHLIGLFRSGLPGLRRPENVDAANCALYKTGNGGGRNPAAAVLWTTPWCEHLLRNRHAGEHP